jgi:hypothetical protein
MNSRKLWVLGIVLSFLIAISLATIVLAQDSTDSNPDGNTEVQQQDINTDDDDSNPTGSPDIRIPDKYLPNTRAPNENGLSTSVYFTPQDENTSTTVIFLYNTTAVTATVGLQTFRLDGTGYISTSFSIPADHLVRIAADPVSTVSSSWTDVIIASFTTNSTYGLLTLPDGIKADGYVAWNGSLTFDPLDAVPTLPLRFSTDPHSVFLPTIQEN